MSTGVITVCCGSSWSYGARERIEARVREALAGDGFVIGIDKQGMSHEITSPDQLIANRSLYARGIYVCSGRRQDGRVSDDL